MAAPVRLRVKVSTEPKIRRRLVGYRWQVTATFSTGKGLTDTRRYEGTARRRADAERAVDTVERCITTVADRLVIGERPGRP